MQLHVIINIKWCVCTKRWSKNLALLEIDLTNIIIKKSRIILLEHDHKFINDS